MKKIILLAVTLALFAVSARAQYDRKDVTPTVAYASTNSITLDARESSTMGLQASFAGIGARTTTVLVGITNAAGATNGQTITITVGTNATAYTWTNAPVTSVTNLSSLAPIVKIGVTNFANATNGNTLTVALNSRTNTFTWTNSVNDLTDVSTNSNNTNATVNLYNAISAVYPGYVMSRTDAAITWQGNVGDSLLVTPTGFWGTNQNTSVYTVTNVVSTNVAHLQQTNSAPYSITNLYTKLTNDYLNVLTITYDSDRSLNITTILNPGLTEAHTGAWATNLITTNAIAGALVFHGSNSLDGVTWFRDATKDFGLSYSTTADVKVITNFTTIGAFGWFAWSVENATANYAVPDKLKIQTTVKKGL